MGVITPSSSNTPITAGMLDLFASDMTGFIAEMVMPGFRVSLQSSVYKVRSAYNAIKVPEAKFRANGAELDDDVTEFAEKSWSTRELGRARNITNRERADHLTKFGIDLWTLTPKDLVFQTAAIHEAIVAALTFNTTTLPLGGQTGADVSGTSWYTPAASTPITDINAAKTAVEGRCGFEPNTLILPNKRAGRQLVMSDEVRSSLGLTYNDQANMSSRVTPEILQGIFDIPRVGMANVWTINGYQPSGSPASVWNSNYAWLGYVNPSQNIGDFTWGRTYWWDWKAAMFSGEHYPLPKNGGERFEVTMDVDQQVVNSTAGYLFKIA